MAAIPYHFTMDFVSRGNTRGRATSATAKAAYNAREAIHDDHSGKTHDFSDKDGHVWSGIFVPENAPEWMHDRERLWNAAEAMEVKKDGEFRQKAQLARTVEMSLPAELTSEQQKQVLTDYSREQWQRKGIVADVSLHEPEIDGGKNWHAHVMLSMREVTPEGFGDKLRGDWATRGDWQAQEKAQLVSYRERWAEMCANRLEREGFTVEAERWRHGHEKLEVQQAFAVERGDLEYAERCSGEAQIHLGPNVAAMEAKGVPTERGQIHRDIDARNESGEAQKATSMLRDARAAVAEQLFGVNLELAEIKVDPALEKNARLLNTALADEHVSADDKLGLRQHLADLNRQREFNLAMEVQRLQDRALTPEEHAQLKAHAAESAKDFRERQDFERWDQSGRWEETREQLAAERLERMEEALDRKRDSAVEGGRGADAGLGEGDGLNRGVGRMADGLGNAATKIMEAAADFLVGKPPEKHFTDEQLLFDSRAAEENAAQRLAAIERREALDRMSKNFEINDMRYLNTTELEAIKAQGNPALDTILRRHEEEQQRHYTFGSGLERERERDR